MSGPFGSSQWMYASGGFYDFPISNSLRFNSDTDSSYLSFTPSSASNLKTWSWSAWVKKSLNDNDQCVFSCATAVSALYIDNAESFVGFDGTYGGTRTLRYSTNKTRDVSAWYHVLFVLDTTQGTAANRLRVYVNGVEDALATAQVNTYPAQDSDGGINTAVQHAIGRRDSTTDLYFGGYLAEINFIDGTALTPSSFGETKNDIWIPKDTSGLTFGTNGYRLQFKQTGTSQNSSGIGADTSGNDNHYAVNNLVASDVVPDSPTNNFATMNPLIVDPNPIEYSEGNLKIYANVACCWRGAYGNLVTSGKWYYEFLGTAQTLAANVGIMSELEAYGTADPQDLSKGLFYKSTGVKRNGTSESSYGASFAVGDIIGIALDKDNNTITFYKNNSSQGELSLASYNVGTDNVYISIVSAKYTSVMNFGQDSSFAGAKTAQGNADGNGIGDFYYAPPSGFLALCTANLPDPVAAIDPAEGGSPQDYFNTIIWSGTGSSNALDVGFQPDFTWIKRRNGTQSHNLHNSVNGATKFLISNTTAAEQTDSSILASFDTNGITVGDNTWSNASGGTYVGWNWKAGTAFSNDASATGIGTIDSAGSVNTDAGFSIIGYTGTGSAGSIAHGLGVAPEMVVVKVRSTTNNWCVYHVSTGNGNYTLLNTTVASAADGGGFWNGTTPSTSVITLGSAGGVNLSGGTFIAYCFASVDGYSRFGQFIGNGNADGPFVYTGFRPAWVMIKRTDSARSWAIVDNVRDPDNEVLQTLEADNSDAEYGNSNVLDFLSNGFKTRSTGPSWNASGGTYIYMAFAEQPFKYANAR